MDIRYLQEFVILAQTGNFLEAADLLFISQSTLSKHVKHMETELGVPLFHRTTRKVELSEFGHKMLPYARQITHLQRKCSSELLQTLERSQNRLEVGSIPALAQYHISDVLVLFREESRSMAVNINQSGSRELKEMLRREQCELAFIRETKVRDDEFQRVPYDMDTLAAVLPAQHPLAAHGAIPLEQLRDEDLMFIEKNTMMYDLCHEACVQSGFRPKVAFTDHRLEHLFDFVVKGLGIALLPKKLALYSVISDIVIVDLLPRVTTRINLCYLKGHRLSPGAKHFLQCAKEVSLKNKHKV